MKATKGTECWNYIKQYWEHVQLFMSKKLPNITSATYTSLQFVCCNCKSMHFFTLFWKVLKSKSQSTRYHISLDSNLAYAHAAEVPSFVTLLFAFIPTDGALIRPKQVSSVFGDVDMYVHIIHNKYYDP